MLLLSLLLWTGATAEVSVEVGGEGLSEGSQLGSGEVMDDADAKLLRKHLWRDGFVRLPGLVPAVELVATRAHIINATRAQVARCSLCANADDIGDAACLGCARTRATPASFPKSFVRAKNLHRGRGANEGSAAAAETSKEAEQLRAVRALLLSPRLARTAASLLGCRGGASGGGARLYQVHQHSHACAHCPHKHRCLTCC